jgi:hypothetical protein
MSVLSAASSAARSFVFRLACLAAVFGVLLALLLTLVRPWYLGWGASPEERARLLPGSEHMPGSVNDTRAIDIAAPAPQVFGWVSQLGQNRAGFYSYTALENLVGCRMPDVRQLDPALQRWNVGDKLWMYPADKLDGMGHASLSYYEADRVLVFGTHSPVDAAGSAPTGGWAFVVEPTGPSSARLLTRGSGGAMPSALGAAYTRTVFEPLHFAMERRMLEGIKGLAEGHPITRASDVLQLLSWFVSFTLFITSAVLVLLGSRFRRRLLGFAAAGVVFQIVTLVQPIPIVSILLIVGLCAFVWPTSRSKAYATGERSIVGQPS